MKGKYFQEVGSKHSCIFKSINGSNQDVCNCSGFGLNQNCNVNNCNCSLCSESSYIDLIDPFEVGHRIKVFYEKLEEFVAFAEDLNYGVCPVQCSALVVTIKEELQIILEELERANRAGEHFKYESLFEKVVNTENLFIEDKEYTSVVKAWFKGTTQAKLEDLRSIETIKLELEKKKIREQRRVVKQKHQQEISSLKSELEQKIKFLEKAEIENKNLTEEVKKTKSDFGMMKQSLISSLNLSEHSDFSLLNKIITGENKQVGSDASLEYKLCNPKHMELIKSLNRRMPDIDILNLANIPVECQEVKIFMGNCFPSKVRSFHFNSDSCLSCSLGFYLDELMEVSQRVTGHLYIYQFEVSQDQLVALFAANRHTECFGFTQCKLDLSSVPDFRGSLAGSTMKGLDLNGCRDFLGGDWGDHGMKFENLIAGLAQEEDFRENLEEIYMSECAMEEDLVEKILSDHGFGHVKIEEYSK
ncbi:unnamed protein product [Moneuplotes crassus]|uniref:Uncharacterized protein n=1 Tax=Euplotes crassus TaxID=5936 RepID=A0AAD2D2C3_EUPCR|nr:unnamed protein product [Moneuplotes crassus]